ncbi:hypothetical protein F751_3469 [Auxenochlorella protothecoides]|uniref:Uncharacterized protein n=1 Tax=Auxenochlorella protothecoides TaxID=3075 RepID=A0A087SC24_AUXPR|nr:hypothetical protein F751_3469 [Auxenochlorella protothecoides]KFM23278.1 hypothetical protein F751_3469 [Auxenochlorella protothecoides]
MQGWEEARPHGSASTCTLEINPAALVTGRGTAAIPALLTHPLCLAMPTPQASCPPLHQPRSRLRLRTSFPSPLRS